VAACMLRKPFKDAVFMVNALRGRDAFSNKWRASVSVEEARHGMVKHRAFEMFHCICESRAGALIRRYGEAEAARICGVSHPHEVRELFMSMMDIEGVHLNMSSFPSQTITRSVICALMTSVALPAFHSYKSGALRYDSAVFSNPSALGRLGDVFPANWKESSVFQQETSRQIAAMRAIRTRRMASA
jgi:hypothetical protein